MTLELQRNLESALEDIQQQRGLLQKQLDLGIISLVDATREFDMIKEKELLIKMKLVDEVHVCDDGSPRTIRTDAKTGNVFTKLKGGKLLKAKDLERMYDKLYSIYFGDYVQNSIDDIFELALREKESTENPKQGTVARYRTDYNRFISADLRKKNICTLTEIDLKTYTQNLVNGKEQIKGKSFMAYKGVLNLIFGYATAHGIIVKNPVQSIRNAVYLKSCDNSKPKSEDKIFTPQEIQMMVDEVKRRESSGSSRWGNGYYVYSYAMQFSIQTGVRVGELCGLMWNDIDFDNELIHIHAQQLTKTVDHETIYYYVPYTKDEKGISQGGRYFPVTNDIRELLLDLAQNQTEHGINSPYVFCYEDGTWMKTLRYGEFLRKLCKKFGFEITNNHGFRMSLNSNVLIPSGISTADRAKLLGHSVETNLKHYSYAQRDYLDKAREILNENGHTTQNEVYPSPKKVYLTSLDFSKIPRKTASL